jgi:hypothetical protein
MEEKRKMKALRDRIREVREKRKADVIMIIRIKYILEKSYSWET